MNHEVRIRINASPDVIWETLADVERWPEWTRSVRAVELLDSTLAVGHRVRIRQPKLPSLVWTISEVEPGVSFSWRSAPAGGGRRRPPRRDRQRRRHQHRRPCPHPDGSPRHPRRSRQPPPHQTLRRPRGRWSESAKRAPVDGVAMTTRTRQARSTVASRPGSTTLARAANGRCCSSATEKEMRQPAGCPVAGQANPWRRCQRIGRGSPARRSWPGCQASLVAPTRERSGTGSTRGGTARGCPASRRTWPPRVLVIRFKQMVKTPSPSESGGGESSTPRGSWTPPSS